MRGVYTAVVTPMSSSGEIDFETFKSHVQRQAKAGIHGVVPCGTTGESPTLSHEEKKKLIQISLEATKGTQTKVVAGTGSNDTDETVELSKWASDQGVHGILVVTPYYNKPSQTGLQKHFAKVADAVKCEVMLYNVPGRTGVSLTADSIATLASHPKIRSIKEATGNPAFTSEILDLLSVQKKKMDVLSGDDLTYLPLLSIGAAGIVSVASNVIPEAMVEIQAACDRGDYKHGLELHLKYFALFKDLFIESNPSPVKASMELMGLCKSAMRAPLAPMTEANLGLLKATLKRCQVVR